MFKVSKFNIKIEDGEKYLIFNTLTSSLIRVEKDTYHKIFEQFIFDDKGIKKSLFDMGYIVDEDIDENYKLLVSKQRFKYAVKGITSAVIAVTTECNARCYYCYENGIKRVPMTMETADAIVDFLDKNSITRKLTVQWFGGEPLCAVDVIDRISNGLIHRGIEISSLITTNGYCINDEILDKAKNVWNLKRFQIPVDALNEDYDTIKNYIDVEIGGSAFEKVIKNIHKVLDAGFHVNVRTNFNPNDTHPTKEVLRFLAKEFKGESRFFAYPEPITGVSMPSVVDGDFAGKIHPYFDLLLEARELGFLCPTLLKEENYYAGDESLSGIKLTSRPTGCYATNLNSFAIDSKGDLYKCHRQLGRKEYSCGNVWSGFIYNSVLKNFCDDTYCYDECNDCALLPLCHGGCKVKKASGGLNGCLAIKSIVKDIIKVFNSEL